MPVTPVVVPPLAVGNVVSWIQLSVAPVFLLTAIANWTGRPPVSGTRLAALAVLWLVGRLACSISADLPAWIAVAADLAFPAALLAVAAHEIIAGKNWRNIVVMGPLSLFLVADLLMHLESLGWAVPSGLGWRPLH